MGIFAADNFLSNGTSTPDLSTHTGDQTPAITWTKHGSFPSGAVVVNQNNNGIHSNVASTATSYFASPTPPSANYEVIATITQKNAGGVGAEMGVSGRILSGANTMYRLLHDFTNKQISFTRTLNGATGTLGGPYSYDPAASGGNPFTLRLRMNGNTISAYRNGKLLASVTDTNVPGAGFAGVYGQGSGGDTVGTHLGAWLAQDAGAATSYTITAPSSGTVGVPNTFFITPNGSLASAVNFTLSDGGAGGTFSPTVLSVGAGDAPEGSFTYTPTTTGPISISATNNGGLTNPSAVTFTIYAQIAVNNASVVTSPYNWWKNGSTYFQTDNEDASLRSGFTGTYCAIGFDTSNLSGLSIANMPVVEWTVDGSALQTLTLDTTVTGAILASNLSSGNHNFEIWYRGRGADTVNRFAFGTTPQLAVRITGFALDPGAALQAPTGSFAQLLKKLLLLGDSITGNCYINSNCLEAYGTALAAALGCEEGRVAFSGQGWGHQMTGGVAATTLLDTYLMYDDTHSREAELIANPPDIIVINQGTNDSIAGVSDTTVAANMTTILNKLRTDCPNAIIFVVVPFGQFKASIITSTVAARADANIRLLNLGANFSLGLTNVGAPTLRSVDALHPDVKTHAQAAAMLAQQIQISLTPYATQGGGGLHGNLTTVLQGLTG